MLTNDKDNSIITHKPIAQHQVNTSLKYAAAARSMLLCLLMLLLAIMLMPLLLLHQGVNVFELHFCILLSVSTLA